MIMDSHVQQIPGLAPEDLEILHKVQAGLPITAAEVSAMFAAVDVSEQSAEGALARLGLRIIATPEG